MGILFLFCIFIFGNFVASQDAEILPAHIPRRGAGGLGVYGGGDFGTFGSGRGRPQIMVFRVRRPVMRRNLFFPQNKMSTEFIPRPVPVFRHFIRQSLPFPLPPLHSLFLGPPRHKPNLIPLPKPYVPEVEQDEIDPQSVEQPLIVPDYKINLIDSHDGELHEFVDNPHPTRDEIQDIHTRTKRGVVTDALDTLRRMFSKPSSTYRVGGYRPVSRFTKKYNKKPIAGHDLSRDTMVNNIPRSRRIDTDAEIVTSISRSYKRPAPGTGRGRGTSGNIGNNHINAVISSY